MDFNRKKVILLGAGRSNAAAMKYACSAGAEIELREYDSNNISDDFYKYCSKIKTGAEYAKNLDCDILIKTPVIRPDIPEIIQAKKNGTVVTSESQLFFEITKAKIIAVTGSSGKTTTTSIIYEMLKKEYKNVYIGGNIGIPLMEYSSLAENDIIAAELSSFQLMDMKKPPHTAVVTNIYPNHLDVHKNMEEYINAKRNIVRFGPEKSVLNFDDETVRNFDGAKKKIYFSMKNTGADIYFKDGYIYMNGEKFFDTAKIKIPGKFNINNYMAAMGAVSGICTDIISAAEDFRGAPHRNSFVANIGGIDYFESSIDSSPDRTAATLSAYDRKVILLAGGRGKGVPYDMLEDAFRDKVKLLIVTGENAEELAAAAKKSNIRIIYAPDYSEAVKYAKKEGKRGDIVLLSPASTSFDAFRNFEERGDYFKKCVLS